jgi:hypothetical protein
VSRWASKALTSCGRVRGAHGPKTLPEMTCGRVPEPSPPSRGVVAGPEIPACRRQGKYMGVVFHNELY